MEIRNSHLPPKLEVIWALVNKIMATKGIQADFYVVLLCNC